MIRDLNSQSLLPFNISSLIASLPEIRLLNCSLNIKSFKKPIDSSDMGIEQWQEIANLIEKNYDSHDGFVILHGTDTMAYTASTLSFMLENLGKPVILTGSQLPIGDLRTDAKENVITAIELATLKQPNNSSLIQEVAIYFENKLFRGNRTTKISIKDFDAFKSYNYPLLATSGITLNINKEYLSKNNGSFNVHKKLNTNIISVKIQPYLNLQWLKSILDSSIQAIILETYGAGNTMHNPEFLSILEQAIKNDIIIVNISQCKSGFISMGKYEASSPLKKLGVISALDMTFESALGKLSHLLANHNNIETVKHLFCSNLRGEISEIE